MILHREKVYISRAMNRGAERSLTSRVLSEVQAARSDRFSDSGRFGFVRFDKATSIQLELGRVTRQETKRRREMRCVLNQATKL